MDLINDLIREPFGADAARELCRISGLFDRGRLYRRLEIVETLRKEFVHRGGDSGATNDSVALVLKKWIMGSASPFRREMRGRYRFLGIEGEEAFAADAKADAVNEASVVHDGPIPEREIAEGPCEVYAWCLPCYQATAARWPIKIGRAGPGGFKRRLRDFQENLPEQPRYLLRLGCADDAEARRREMLLHAWFTSRGQKLEGVSGDEWFQTNPEELEEAIGNLMGLDSPERRANTHGPENIVAAAFKGVTADDWAQLPEDLSDRLDEHLYGGYLR